MGIVILSPVTESDYNPRMPLTAMGILYLFGLVAAAIGTAYIVIRGLDILDDDIQYAVTIGLIVLYIGIFFCRDSIWIGIGKRTFWSFVLALMVFLLLVANGLFLSISFPFDGNAKLSAWRVQNFLEYLTRKTSFSLIKRKPAHITSR